MSFTRGVLEDLESRVVFSVSLPASGFAVITPSSDTRTIYVSSSTGSDQNDGRSPQHPIKTIARGESMMRDGKPDHLLLKRGDRFLAGFGDLVVSGRSADEPILIGSYGKGPRPLINSGVDEGIGTSNTHYRPIDNIIVKGLHFVAGSYDGTNGGFQTSGVHLVGQADHWLVEDCSIEGYKDNVVLDAAAGVSNFTLRRCEILDAYCASSTVGNGHAQGIYVSGTSVNTLIDQNIFDHNGWNEDVAGAEPTWFNHSMYINTGAVGTVITDNIVTRSSLRGVLLRAGGVVDDNLFIQNPVAIQVGNTKSAVTGNVILSGISQPGISSGVGIDVIGLPSARIASNIIANQQSATKSGAAGIQLEAGVKKTIVTSNIVYAWHNPILNAGTASVSIRTNELQNNDYAAPTRSMASYNASIGGRRTVMAWIDALRNQSESGWNANYSARPAVKYIREGFEHRS